MSIKDRASVSESLKGGGGVNIEDCFSTYVYTGNDSLQTVSNGLNLADDGGLTITRCRDSATMWHVQDTERGGDKLLYTNATNAESAASSATLTFATDGYSLNSLLTSCNSSLQRYASWSWKKQPRFFDIVKYTGNGVAGREIAHELGCDVGMIIVKRLDIANSYWPVYHRGIERPDASANGGMVSLNGTWAQSDLNLRIFFGNGTISIPPTESMFTVNSYASVNESGATYIAYLYAHDPLGESGDGSDSLIQCGSYVGTAVTGQEIDLGWEPQYVMIKDTSRAENWYTFDTMRGIISDTSSSRVLSPNQSVAEFGGTVYQISATATGFKLVTTVDTVNGLNETYIYMAIKRGMKTPESSDEVFANSLASGDPRFPSTFPVDFVLQSVLSGADTAVYTRLTGSQVLKTNTTAAESASSWKWDINEGSGGNFTSTNYVGQSFKRAKGFFDVVAYTGDGIAGRTVNHNLGVVPELVIHKHRTLSVNWTVWHKDIRAVGRNWWEYGGSLNQSSAFYEKNLQTYSPTLSEYPVESGWTNVAGVTNILYLFSSLAGISKVGSYTGNGTSQTIDAGFSTGAKFILIKRTDSAGDWYFWDVLRGIVAGNDPHLSLNTTAAEVTTDDSIDPDTSGFIVNQNATTNINVTSATYIYYSIATPL